MQPHPAGSAAGCGDLPPGPHRLADWAGSDHLRHMADADPLAASLADRYRVERELGRGGMATVYLAEDLKHHRRVAIKVLRPEIAMLLGAERFVQEIATTAQLQHPHILPLFDSGTADGVPYYVMPYVDGETLRDRLDRETQLPVEDALRIARETADALSYAHARGVIHRDIKPENILLESGHALVADFGVALAVESAGGQRITQSGVSIGTPQYMSPEQAAAERTIDTRSDIYALGAVTYEMLTGEPPFTGPSVQAVVSRVLSEDPRPLGTRRKTIPPSVEAAVLTALQKLPADRFATAAEFGAALEEHAVPLAVRPTTRSGAGAGPATRRSGTLPRLVLGGAVVVALVALALSGWLRPRPPAPVSRHEIVLGHATDPGVVAFGSAIAGDGSAIVFSDTAGGAVRLWIKERGEAHPRPLAPLRPANPAGPAFSPDGRWVIYSHEKLQKVPRQGGTPVVVSDSEAAYGSAWLDDGTVVYIAGAGDRVFVTTASGGTTIPVLSSDAVKGRFVRVTAVPHRHAVLLGVGGTTPRVIALDLDTRKVHDVVGGATAAWVIPGGTLVYAVSTGELFGVRFDADKLATVGSPVSLLDGIQTVNGAPDVTVGNDGTLLYVEGQALAGAGEAQIVAVSRDGAARPLAAAWKFAPPLNGGLALSPDGRRLALSATDSATGRSDLYVVTLATGLVTRLTFEGDLNIRPAWSPDGRSVLYVSTAGGKPELWRKRADGSGRPVRVLSETRAIYEGFWSPDGKWIIYRTDNVQQGSGDILAVPARGGRPIPLAATPAQETGPALSPDGHWLAFASDASGRKEIYVRPFPNASDGIWQVSTDGGSEPRWSHDGRELFYRNADGEMIAASITPGSTFSAGRHTRLFSARAYWNNDTAHYYAISLDGRTFFMVRNTGPEASVAGHLMLVEHWFQEVAAKMGGSRP